MPYSLDCRNLGMVLGRISTLWLWLEIGRGLHWAMVGAKLVGRSPVLVDIGFMDPFLGPFSWRILLENRVFYNSGCSRVPKVPDRGVLPLHLCLLGRMAHKIKIFSLRVPIVTDKVLWAPHCLYKFWDLLAVQVV